MAGCKVDITKVQAALLKKAASTQRYLYSAGQDGWLPSQSYLSYPS